MILQQKIILDSLLKEGKNFKWEECQCSDCGCLMWGHGFVGRYFEESAGIVFLKRYRCSKCGKVITIRPEGYWPRIRSSILTIFVSLIARLRDKIWPKKVPHQRGGHWLARFCQHAKMENQTDLVDFLTHSFKKGLNFLPQLLVP